MGRKRKSVQREYSSFLEKFYEKHKWYQNLVFLSKIARMVLYILLGTSVIMLVLNQGDLASFEDFVYTLVGNPLGKILAVFFGVLLIIYGLEKPRN